MKRIRLTANRAVTFGFEPYVIKEPQHGPQSWPFWRLLSIRAYRANPDIPFDVAPVHHWLTWFYTRWGAVTFYFAIDCREPGQLRYAP